jgi:hypothetical protein
MRRAFCQSNNLKLSLSGSVCISVDGNWAQSTYIYSEPQCMSPRRNWVSPNPLSPASVTLPPEPKGAGTHSPAGEGLGESQFRRLEKKLRTLSTLRSWGRVFVGVGTTSTTEYTQSSKSCFLAYIPS